MSGLTARGVLPADDPVWRFRDAVRALNVLQGKPADNDFAVLSECEEYWQGRALERAASVAENALRDEQIRRLGETA